jgi:hypothetical protein
MRSMIRILILFILINSQFSINAIAQMDKQLYVSAFQEQLQMMTGQKQISFKRSVFITENAFYKGKLNYQAFSTNISNITVQLKSLIRLKGISHFKTAGNWAAFSYLNDTIAANGFKPFTYDFEDLMGTKDWSKMFVTKLLREHSGNCHSLPYLYKILCEELGAKASLALAPNHIYIKHLDEKNQWTNVELTSGGFPRDQWIIKEMAITVEAIKKGIYMVPLSPKQSIAMTMFDLACGYKFRYGYDKFVLNTITTALKYFPKCVPLIQLKANCMLALYQQERKKNKPNTLFLESVISSHKKTVVSINQLGYKEMPKELYAEWIRSVEKEKQKRKFPGNPNKKQAL